MSATVVCPYCGGNRLRQITPSEFECQTPHPGGLVPPGPKPFSPMRPCGHLFQVSSEVRSPLCACGLESIGQCSGCGRALCGNHGGGGSESLCEGCRQGRLLDNQAREERASQDHEAGLVEFRASTDPAREGDRLPLRSVWAAVFNALKERQPRADVSILDERRLDELPSRWPPTGGWRRERNTAKWNAAVDRLGVPAWSTESGLSAGRGIADTFSIDHDPLYVGRNGVLYCAPARPTPEGTLAEWRGSYQSADEIPGVWSARWLPYGTYYPRQEIADALANLATIHGLGLEI